PGICVTAKPQSKAHDHDAGGPSDARQPPRCHGEDPSFLALSEREGSEQEDEAERAPAQRCVEEGETGRRRPDEAKNGTEAQEDRRKAVGVQSKDLRITRAGASDGGLPRTASNSQGPRRPRTRRSARDPGPASVSRCPR